MINTSKRIYSLALLALLTAPLASTAQEEGAEDDERVVFNRRICPEIKIGDGQSVHWLGYSKRAFLGVELTNLSPELRSHFGVPGQGGVMISRVVEESAAAAAGLAVGDIVTHVDGTEVGSSGSLGRALRDREEGETVDIDFRRQGSAQRVTATLAAHERCAFDVSNIMEDFDFEELTEFGVGISEEVLKGLQEAFEGQDWSKSFEGLEDLNIEGLEGLEERMERVQERLQRLERELEREHRNLERDEERLERERRRERERSRGGNESGETSDEGTEDLETVRL